MDMITVSNVSKFYGPTKALDNISFTVKKGEVLGFLGPNGAGKTTTISILTCLFPPTEGTATVAGYDIFKDPIEVNRSIGYVPESFSLYTDMRVKEYLRYVSEIKGIPRKEIAGSIEKVVEETETKDVYTKGIKKLSRGYLQRVGVAQSLLGDPPVLIFDEPTIGLDPMQIISIRNLIKSLSGDRTVVLASHILPEVSQVTERVIVIKGGKLVAMDTPKNLMKSVKATGRIIVTVDGDETKVEKAIKKVDGVKSVKKVSDSPAGSTYHVEVDQDKDIKGALSRAVIEGGFNLVELRLEDVTLEDIFIKLVTDK
ncbi:MAG: ATP-binding cassette domain-containing protein [Deltaproteobacteria bacterium]|uniref:ATP-binding cassette domain-containing protein n=1 Tax=Candidatus Zymogenus saltonus TaxID=2844893 RepID=A0A9D8KFA2_9DELT|nr:ATP-binding cassette domain-containing protein [Candidatus Zymogenus saltonus]